MCKSIGLRIVSMVGLLAAAAVAVGCSDAARVATAGAGKGGTVEMPGEMVGGPPGSRFFINASNDTSVEYEEFYENGQLKRRVTKKPETVVLARANGAIEIAKNETQNFVTAGNAVMGWAANGVPIVLGGYSQYQDIRRQNAPPEEPRQTPIQQLREAATLLKEMGWAPPTVAPPATQPSTQ